MQHLRLSQKLLDIPNPARSQPACQAHSLSQAGGAMILMLKAAGNMDMPENLCNMGHGVVKAIKRGQQ